MSSYARIIESLIKHPRYAYRDTYLEGLSQTDNGLLVAAFNIDMVYSQQQVGRLILKTTILTKISAEEAIGYNPDAYQRYFPRPENSRNCLVYLHSHHGCRAEGTYLVKLLENFDASLVLFDFAGAGESDGQYTSFGWFEGEQASSVIGQLISKFKFEKIGVWGKSMGACAALRYRTIALHPQVVFMVIDSSFDKLKHALISIAKEHSKAPTFAIKSFIYYLSKTVQDKAFFDIYKVKPIDWVPNIKGIPIFFVKGNVDKLVTKEEFESLYTGCQSSEKILIITEGSHAGNRVEEDEQFKKFITEKLAIYFPPAKLVGQQSQGAIGESASRFRQLVGSVSKLQKSVANIAQFHQSNYDHFNKSMHPDTGLILQIDELESPATNYPSQPVQDWQITGPRSPPLTSSNQITSPIETKPRSLTLQHSNFNKPSIKQPVGSPKFNGGFLAGYNFPSIDSKPKAIIGNSKPLPPPPPPMAFNSKTTRIYDSKNTPNKSLTKQVTQLDTNFAFASMLEQPIDTTQEFKAPEAPKSSQYVNNQPYSNQAQLQDDVYQHQSQTTIIPPQQQDYYFQPAQNQLPAQQTWQAQDTSTHQQQQDFQPYEYGQPAFQEVENHSGQQYYAPSRSSAPAQFNYINHQNQGYSQTQEYQYQQQPQMTTNHQHIAHQYDAAYANHQQPIQNYSTSQQALQYDQPIQANPYISTASQYEVPKPQRAANMNDSMGHYFNR
jgi:esterase/lipase